MREYRHAGAPLRMAFSYAGTEADFTSLITEAEDRIRVRTLIAVGAHEFRSQ
jgi:hypothetical protein